MTRAYLLAPMMPTPNGPLHLGHISGPYLRMDVLARALRQEGADVALVTTSDAFESHVLASAERLGLDPLATTRHFHEAIRRDFQTMAIALDDFADATADPAYHATHAAFVDELMARDAVQAVREETLVDAETNAPLLGHELTGDCPGCGATTVGFVCERCGLQVTTRMLKNPRGPSGRPLAWSSATTLALAVDRDGTIAAIDRMPLQPEFLNAMRTFIAEPDNIVRLTILGHHGVGRHDVRGEALMLYNTYFGHARYWGRWWAARHDGQDPFAPGSAVTTVTSCGLDNATDLAATAACARAHGAFKGYDHALGNFFLTLDGTKFSTGLDHAVFVHEVAARGLDVDAMRVHLASISPEEAVSDFTRAAFLAAYNDWYVPLRQRLHHILGELEGQRAPWTLAHPALPARATALALPNLSLRRYATLVRETQPDAETIAGFAVLIAPLMPHLAQALWTALGADGAPQPQALAPTRPVTPLAPVAPLTLGDLP